jgi:hypothetical protein
MRSSMTSRLVSLLALLSLAPPLAAQDALPLTVCAVFDGLPLPGMAVTAEYPGAAARAAAATADDGCTALQVPVVTGLEAPPDERPLDLQLYPNPTAGGQLAVEVSGDAASAALYDATGRRLTTLLRKDQAPGASTHASFEHLAAGLYFVRLTGKTRTRGAVKAFVHLGGSLELRMRFARFSPASPPPEPHVTYSAKTSGYTIHLDLAADGYAPISADTTFFTGDTLTFALKKNVEITILDGTSNDITTLPRYAVYDDSLVVTAFTPQGDTLSGGFANGSFSFVTPFSHYFLSVVSPGNEGFVGPFLKSGSSDIGDFINNVFGVDNLSEGAIIDDFFSVVSSVVPSHNNFVGGVSSGQVDSLSALVDSSYVIVFPVDSLLAGSDDLGSDFDSGRDVYNFYLNDPFTPLKHALARLAPVVNPDGSIDDTLHIVFGVHEFLNGFDAPPWTSADSTTFVRLYYEAPGSWRNIVANALVDPMVPVLSWSEDWADNFNARNHFVAAYDPDLALTIGTAVNYKLVDGRHVLFSFGVINGGRGPLGADFFNDGYQAFTPGTVRQGGLSVRFKDSEGLDNLRYSAAGSAIFNIVNVFTSGFIISSNPTPLNVEYGKNGFVIPSDGSYSPFIGGSSFSLSRSDDSSLLTPDNNGLLTPHDNFVSSAVTGEKTLYSRSQNSGLFVPVSRLKDLVVERTYFDGLKDSSGMYSPR